jgi:hypothetical protein
MMEIRGKVVFAAAIAVLALAQVGRAQVNADGDWQFWTHERANIKITDNITGTVGAMYRFGDDMSKLWYQHYDAGVIFKTTKWLSIMPSYRLKMVDAEYSKKFKGDDWINIQNPSLNFILTHKLGKLKLKNNCRFSYWDYDSEFGRDDLLYYRNIFMVAGPAWTKAKISPYIQEDFFFNTDIGQVDRNRLSTGLLLGKWKAVTPKLYVMWQAFNPTGLEKGSVGLERTLAIPALQNLLMIGVPK